ncbi:unnamed protein product [Oikopleura dioica]|uniref:Uncharacterized protein n=1 Tax=Oikopleura dioica TaxID=34765 RepID=E4XK24_OIKDI|nr:unnamed protein product [Oikopleura dioica]
MTQLLLPDSNLYVEIKILKISEKLTLLA